jgi:hypothetical protein
MVNCPYGLNRKYQGYLPGSIACGQGFDYAGAATTKIGRQDCFDSCRGPACVVRRTTVKEDVMRVSNWLRAATTALALLGFLLSAHALAAPMVTYSWTTTSQGNGPHVDQPTSATFDAPLSVVQSGKISYFDISNIQLFYPGLSFDTSIVSSIGNDFAVFVNPATGALIYQSADQGLAVMAFAGTDINAMTTFLSITVGNPDLVSGTVKDQFNALNNGAAYAGFPTAGYWTATLPPPVPEPETYAMLVAGLGMIGFMVGRRRPG